MTPDPSCPSAPDPSCPSTPDPSCPSTISIGALLVGALAPADRQELQVHLDGCEHCRSELVLLAQLPGLLHRHRLIIEDGYACESPGIHRGAAPSPEAGSDARRRSRANFGNAGLRQSAPCEGDDAGPPRSPGSGNREGEPP